jgi:hypothetical protein
MNHSRLQELKKQLFKERLDSLEKDYTVLFKQMNSTENTVTREQLKRQLEAIEEQIQEVEEELKSFSILNTSRLETSISSPKVSNDLASEKSIDYSKLSRLLAASKWKEANKETYLVMVKAVDKEDGDVFSSNEFQYFPCTDLRTIDQLWVKYSGGRFGFSVQKNIYLSVGGKPDGLYYEVWSPFADKVGWAKGWGLAKRWIQDSEVICDISAPKGHLPTWQFLSETAWWQKRVTNLVHLTSRLEKCNI